MKSLFPIFDKLIVAAFGVFGLWLVVIRPLGPHWAFIPGGLADARLNNYLLEHFYRWITGVDKHFWTVETSFYPFPDTIAFGDNFLGSGPFYEIFRQLGFDRKSAFQGWFVLGYCLNFLSAIYVLSRLHFGALAKGVAAFFFTFGLPLLAQEGHAQLLYRFGVPLACFFLLEMLESPRFLTMVAVIFWSIWQFYLSIYTGVFLTLLLVMLSVFSPLLAGQRSFWQVLGFWPRRVRLAWQHASPIERFLGSLAVIFLGGSLFVLLWDYWRVSRIYGLSREWSEVVTMLPTWRSYLLADNAQLWKPISDLISGVPMRQEHQLFLGIAAVILTLIGVGFLISHLKLENRRAVMLHFWAGSALVICTFLIHGFSIYRILFSLPGMNSLRAITRIILILMWPLALLIAYGVDMLTQKDIRLKLVRVGLAVILSGLLVAESVMVNHYVYSKADSQARLSALREQIPDVVLQAPILVVANTRGDPWSVTELDGMLLGQQLGWAVLNGSGGNLAPGYDAATVCSSIPRRIVAYMDFAKIKSQRLLPCYDLTEQRPPRIAPSAARSAKTHGPSTGWSAFPKARACRGAPTGRRSSSTAPSRRTAGSTAPCATWPPRPPTRSPRPSSRTAKATISPPSTTRTIRMRTVRRSISRSTANRSTPGRPKSARRTTPSTNRSAQPTW